MFLIQKCTCKFKIPPIRRRIFGGWFDHGIEEQLILKQKKEYLNVRQSEMV